MASRKVPICVLSKAFSLYLQFLYGIEPLLSKYVFRILEENPGDNELYALFCSPGGSSLAELGVENQEISHTSNHVTLAVLIPECLKP